MFILTTLDPVRGDSKFYVENLEQLREYFEELDWSSVIRVLVEKKE